MLLDALTGRRLGGALLVLGGIVVAIVVLWPGGGGGHPAKVATTAKIDPVRIVSVPQLGLAFAHPRTWQRTVAGRVIRLRSPGGASVLTFSSPTEGHHTQRAKAETEQALRTEFDPATIVHHGPGKLGGRDASTFELEGFSPDNDAVRALVIVASTAYRTYVVSLLTPGRPSAKQLAEVQQILATVRLTKPLSPGTASG
jgi:hypothetical protein